MKYLLLLLPLALLFTACPDEPKPLSPAQQKRLDALVNKSNPEQMNAELLKLQKEAGARMDDLKALDARKANVQKAKATKEVVAPTE